MKSSIIVSFLLMLCDRTVNVFHYSFLGVQRSWLFAWIFYERFSTSDDRLRTFLSVLKKSYNTNMVLKRSETLRIGNETPKNVQEHQQSWAVGNVHASQNHVHLSTASFWQFCFNKVIRHEITLLKFRKNRKRIFLATTDSVKVL